MEYLLGLIAVLALVAALLLTLPDIDDTDPESEVGE